jgi:hypothetical protein
MQPPSADSIDGRSFSPQLVFEDLSAAPEDSLLAQLCVDCGYPDDSPFVDPYESSPDPFLDDPFPETDVNSLPIDHDHIPAPHEWISSLYGMQDMCSSPRTTPVQIYRTIVTRNHDQRYDLSARAHFDGGSQGTTTNDESLLWHVRDLAHNEVRPSFIPADKTKTHRPTKIGYLCIPNVNSDEGYSFEPCYLTPTLHATIVSIDKLQ